jgi:allantoinase
MNPTPRYPRDLKGHGPNPPHARWPGNARVAVQFVLNYEEGGENSVLHGDAGSEQFLSEMFNAAAYPARHLSMEGIYEYGSRVGVWRILREFERRGLPLTVFGVSMALERCPEVTAAFVELGHEIACHGWRWIHYQNVDEATERDHLRTGMDIIQRLTGERPLGWYTGRDSPNTRRLVADHGGFEYDSDYYGDDLPFWLQVKKTDGSLAPHLVVPYTLDCNDMRFALPQGYSHGDEFFEYLRDAFDVHYAEGDERPAMMSIGMHCRLLGRPGRMKALQRFLDHVQAHQRVWITRRIDIARHWKQVHPFDACHRIRVGVNPGVNMLTLQQINAADQPTFTALLDGTYEHSPWIAERAWAHRPFATLAALKQAFVQVVRGAGVDAQLTLIRAHPELAGKAMVSQTLTAESTNEQGKAGLTDCTPEEFARIQRLNSDYNLKFGWPFILAVRGPRGTGLTRQQIIDTFARRLQSHPDLERAECLRNIHRIAEIRLNDKFGDVPACRASACGTGPRNWPSTATPATASRAS